MAQGNYTLQMEPRSEQAQLSFAINEVVKKLRHITAQINNAVRTVRTGLTQTANRIQAPLDSIAVGIRWATELIRQSEMDPNCHKDQFL